MADKKCPYCAETIKYEAIVCRYCGRDLAPQSPNSSLPLPSQQNVQSQSYSRSKTKCENCGVEAETKYVEFFQNIGMIFMRRYRTVKGNFCKTCIDYYFWSLTGKTIILGWWGVMSFFLTPLILLNNLLRFIFTANMIKPRTRLVPDPSPFWISSTLGGFLIIGYILFLLVSPASARPTNNTIVPTVRAVTSTQRQIQQPTQPPLPTKFQITYNGIPCKIWTSVGNSDIDFQLCIYGKVYAYGPPPKEGYFYEGWNTIQFSPELDSIRMIQFNGTYSAPLKTGDCVAIYGKIRNYGSYLIISPNNDNAGGVLIYQTPLVCDLQ